MPAAGGVMMERMELVPFDLARNEFYVLRLLDAALYTFCINAHTHTLEPATPSHWLQVATSNILLLAESI